MAFGMLRYPAVIAIVASFSAIPAVAEPPIKKEILASAKIARDEGGTEVVTGRLRSRNFALREDLWPNPTVALLNIGKRVAGTPEILTGKPGQVLGYLTEPLFPGPGRYQINLPVAPQGPLVDVDNNGNADMGVRIFALGAAPNLTGDSYLEQAEQLGGLSSLIEDIATLGIIEGKLIVHANDDKQGFPVDRGEDGIWFTKDDRTVLLPSGYTLAVLSSNGQVTFDRSRNAIIDNIERVEAASPDFSKQGILESFNSLIGTLKVRYAFTKFRGLDWEGIRARYLDRVKAADAKKDIGAYFLALRDLALSIEDTHVNVDQGTNIQLAKAFVGELTKTSGGNLGATVISVPNEDVSGSSVASRIVVLHVVENSPAANAGWVSGTEILRVDDMTPEERLATIPLILPIGVSELQRKDKVERFLQFPVGHTATIEYRLPNQSDLRTVRMEAGNFSLSAPPIDSGRRPLPIDYEQRGDYAVVKWNSFMNFLVPKVVVLEEALRIESGSSSSGMILDLRGNTGGLAELAVVMASHFFKPENPMPVNLFDWYYFDAQKGTHIKAGAPDVKVSAPDPKLAYTGPLLVIIDDKCASSCEYFAQYLQLTGRAKVIGQYMSKGAGGPIDIIAMPGGMKFQYTMGRTTFAGTQEPNLEAKGVIPDMRVPVTLKSEQAKLRGEDPVMQAAFAELDRLNNPLFKLTATNWKWTKLYDQKFAEVKIDDPDKYTISFAADGTMSIKADCNRAQGKIVLSGKENAKISIGPVTLATCPPGSQSDKFLKHLTDVTGLSFNNGEPMFIVNPESGLAAIALSAVEYR